MNDVLCTSNLVKQYKSQKAVDDVSLHIERGQIYGFIGRNGAGKTTFLKMVSGLAEPTSGDISLFGSSGSERKKMYPRIGTLIEQPGLYPGISAYENLKLKCICVGIKRDGYIESLLKTVGLENTGKKKVKAFSQGMKQRLGIALALVGEPDLLLLDEPINGLDPQGMVEVRDIILNLRKEKNMTIMVSSHILEELSKIATAYGIIHQGRLIKEMNMEELAQACGEYIEIKTSSVNLVTPVLDRLGIRKYKVTDNGKIQIFERLNESGKINMEIARNNIEIHSISVINQSIEDYFLNLTGGAHNV